MRSKVLQNVLFGLMSLSLCLAQVPNAEAGKKKHRLSKCTKITAAAAAGLAMITSGVDALGHERNSTALRVAHERITPQSLPDCEYPVNVTNGNATQEICQVGNDALGIRKFCEGEWIYDEYYDEWVFECYYYCTDCYDCGTCSSGGGGRGCFPQESFVKVRDAEENEALVSMDQLQIGDEVQVGYAGNGEAQFAKVLDIPHRDTQTQDAVYIRVIFTSGGKKLDKNQSSILISPKHLIYVAKTKKEKYNESALNTTYAKNLQVGNLIWVEGSKGRVTELRTVKKAGLFAPHTETGKILIFGQHEAETPVGVLASCYSDVTNPNLAHKYFQCRRFCYPPKSIEEQGERDAGPWENWMFDCCQKISSAVSGSSSH